MDALAPELEGLDDVEGRHAGLQAGTCRIGASELAAFRGVAGGTKGAEPAE